MGNKNGSLNGESEGREEEQEATTADGEYEEDDVNTCYDASIRFGDHLVEPA